MTKRVIFTYSVISTFVLAFLILFILKVAGVIPSLPSDIATLALIVVVVVFVFIYMKEVGKIKNGMLQNQDNFQDFIAFCKEMENKLFIRSAVNIVRAQLVNLYMYINENDKAKELLAKLPKKSILTLYPRFIFAAVNENMEMMNYYYNKLLMVRNANFDIQRENALRIIEMVENKEFDEGLYNETTYYVVKGLCLKYKK